MVSYMILMIVQDGAHVVFMDIGLSLVNKILINLLYETSKKY